MELKKLKKDKMTKGMDVLKIEGVTWEVAISKSLSKKRPKEGWPDKEDLRKKKKK